MSHTHITLKGVTYDHETGERLTTSHAPISHSGRHRTYAHREATPTSRPAEHQLLHKRSRTISPRETLVYADHPHKATARVNSSAKTDTPAQPHSLAERALRSRDRPMPARPSAKQQKESAIAHALALAPTRHKTPRKKPSFLARKSHLATAGIALMLLAGYFSYLSMPSLSVRVAALQSGVDAQYPSYHPAGYRLSGPVNYSEGVVTLTFTSNADSHSYTIAQHRATDSSNTLSENFIRQHVGNSYITNRAGDTLIYSQDATAAWLHEGVLYTLTGDAPLGADQIARIVSSV